MRVAIVKYNAGNVRSVENSLRRLGVEPLITDIPDELLRSDKVIFPGVGEASTAMNHLRSRGLDRVLLSMKQPVLAVCLGMQLLCESSEENDARCFGILPHRVRRFPASDLKVPQIGWNELTETDSPIFDGLGRRPWVYFVHAYFVERCGETIASANYGVPFSAAVRKDNFYGVQFHPEKSGTTGARILANFLNL